MLLVNGWKVDKSNPDTERFHLNKVLAAIYDYVTSLTVAVSGLDTNDVTEGTNLYFTEARVQSTPLPDYTVASLPTPEAGLMIYVTDETGGAVPAFGDGTNFRRVTDRAIVS